MEYFISLIPCSQNLPGPSWKFILPHEFLDSGCVILLASAGSDFCRTFQGEPPAHSCGPLPGMSGHIGSHHCRQGCFQHSPMAKKQQSTMLVIPHLRRNSCQHSLCPSFCAVGLFPGSGIARGASPAVDPFCILGHSCSVSSGPVTSVEAGAV